MTVDYAQNVHVGAVLRGLREDAGLSCREVSERLGTHTRGTIAAWEEGVRTISVLSLVALCAVYEAPVSLVVSAIENRQAT